MKYNTIAKLKAFTRLNTPTAKQIKQKGFVHAEGMPLQRIHKIGRNEPCPCGSGKKWKQCHLPLEEAKLIKVQKN